MSGIDRPSGLSAARLELLLVFGVGWLLHAAVPLALGGIGLSWDALNHHMYLGWIAQEPRFHRDFLAASYQSYQYPYLYWPAFRLMEAGASGLVAGLVLVSLHALAVPALWLVARVCVPGTDWYGTMMRTAAVVLACSGQLYLSLLDTTANDGLAAVPFVWAVALALWAAGHVQPAARAPGVAVAASGLLAGASVAFKFSNGPLALLFPLLWITVGSNWRMRLLQAVNGSAWTLVGFAVAYGYWGWQLWENFGNPMYPFYEPLFAALRAWSGWQP